MEPGRNPPPDDDSEIVHPPHGLRGRLTARLRRRSEPSDPHPVRLALLLEELSAVPTRLITGKRDLWSEWDRLDTEARFRITVAIPVAAAGIAVTDAVYAHTQPWLIWCGWVASAVALFGLGVSMGREATKVLLQALHTGELGQLRTLPRTTGP